MLRTSNTQYPYEHYGDLAVDFGSSDWDVLTANHIDITKWYPTGFYFDVDNRGHFIFYIWAIPVESTPNEKGQTPVKKIKTNITWEEFSKSFVKLNAQAFMDRKGVENFYELSEDE